MEEQVVSFATIARIKRTRPVLTVTARTVKIAIVAIASRRKKNRVAVLLTCYFITIYSILSDPLPSTVICVY